MVVCLPYPVSRMYTQYQYPAPGRVVHFTFMLIVRLLPSLVHSSEN